MLACVAGRLIPLAADHHAVRLLSEHSDAHHVCTHRRTVGVEAAATGRPAGGRTMAAPVRLVRRRRNVVVHVAKPNEDAGMFDDIVESDETEVRSLHLHCVLPPAPPNLPSPLSVDTAPPPC